MDRLPNPLAALFSALAPQPPELTEQRPWRHLFDAKGVQGTFVLHEPVGERWLVHDARRARERFLPHATFDIATALVGLETGALNDELEVFRWDGRPKPVALWERDHDLASGMAFGVAWMFQEIARRVGRARMREWLDRLEYGNRDTGGGIDHFWLQGGLRISAVEQVRFLHRLA